MQLEVPDVNLFVFHSVCKKSRDCSSFIIEHLLIVICDFALFSGLDDLRDWTNNVQPHIPIYVARRDFEVHFIILPFFHHLFANIQ